MTERRDHDKILEFVRAKCRVSIDTLEAREINRPSPDFCHGPSTFRRFQATW